MHRRQIQYILSGKMLWFNEKGGWNLGLDADDIVTVYCDKLLFPNYTEKDIKINRWGGGQHYYAKVGEIEVKECVDGETIVNNP